MSKLPSTISANTFAALVAVELDNARTKNVENINSLHEGYAVILEEVEELWAQVMLKARERNHVNVLEELVQIAAMAQRAAEDLGYVEPDKRVVHIEARGIDTLDYDTLVKRVVDQLRRDTLIRKVEIPGAPIRFRDPSEQT